MTQMRFSLFTLRAAELALAACGLLLLSGCPPEASRLTAAEAKDGNGKYYAAHNKLFESESPFDIRWEVVHEQRDEFDPTRSGITDRQFTINRCTRCHECGFPRAFDMEHYSTPEWKPIYTGQQWSAPIKRMIPKENSFLNDEIATRIYAFLRDETLGLYDESQDDKGAVVIEVEEGELPPEMPQDMPEVQVDEDGTVRNSDADQQGGDNGGSTAG
jgi:hypothetical protein